LGLCGLQKWLFFQVKSVHYVHEFTLQCSIVSAAMHARKRKNEVNRHLEWHLRGHSRIGASQGFVPLSLRDYLEGCNESRSQAAIKASDGEQSKEAVV